MPSIAERYASRLWMPGEVREIRIPQADRYGKTHAGYFDDPVKAAAAVDSYDGKVNVYLTINPVDGALLARSANRIKNPMKDTTADKHIACRRWLPIDIDPKRVAGVSANEAEVDAAHQLAVDVYRYLEGLDWPRPIMAFSGNGYQLLYPIDLPNDDDASSLVAGVLGHLADRFDSDEVVVDTTVSNAARIMAFIGTMKVKGDSTADRPHRRSELKGDMPDELVPVPVDLMRSLVPEKKGKSVPTDRARSDGPDRGWVKALLDSAAIPYREQPPDAAGIAWYGLESCPYHPDDGTPWQCGLGEAPDGRATGKCFHDRGKGKGWQDFKRDLGLGRTKPLIRSTATDDGVAGPDDVERVLPPPSRPMAVAGELVRDGFTIDHKLVLGHWRGTFWDWHHSHWREADEAGLKSKAYRYTEHAIYTKSPSHPLEPWAPNRYKIADLVDALKAISHISESTTMPTWLPGRDGPRPTPMYRASEIVACENGLLHVPTRTLIDHDPAFFNRVAVPFDFDADAPAPEKWHRFLGELWPDDPEAIAALQEWFGYVISGRLDLHKILLLIGPTRSGKGTIARVLEALVGRGNYAGPTLASMAQNFGLQDLIGKPLAVVSDARLGDAHANQVVERLLSISGEDVLTVDRKYKEPWTGTLPTRFLIISNELPRFGDASGAIANRFIVLTLRESWLGKEDPSLTRQLLTELPGILVWALDGLERLQAQGRYTEPASSTDAIMALADLVSPASAFIRDRCIVGPGYEVACDALYQEWRTWAEDNGHRPGSVQTFGRNLRAVVPGLRTVRPRDGEDRERHYQGIGLLTTIHNRPDRGPLRTTSVDVAPVRDGPRSSPLSAGVNGDLRAQASATFGDVR